MTLPGLALFHGGLVSSKNVLSVLSQHFGIACLMSILWVTVGYSLASQVTVQEFWKYREIISFDF